MRTPPEQAKLSREARHKSLRKIVKNRRREPRRFVNRKKKRLEIPPVLELIHLVCIYHQKAAFASHQRRELASHFGVHDARKAETGKQKRSATNESEHFNRHIDKTANNSQARPWMCLPRFIPSQTVSFLSIISPRRGPNRISRSP